MKAFYQNTDTMLTFRLLLAFSCILITTLSFGQIPKHVFNEVTEEAYNPKNFKSTSKSLKQRAGVYHFGESEAEWDLVILQNGDSLIFQIWKGVWDQNYYTKQETWRSQCKTFNKVSVSGNRFYFDKYTGQFAEFSEGTTSTNALLLFCDLISERTYGKDSAAVGFYSTSIDNYFGDRDYPELSTAVQPDSFFSGRSKQELRIMRNTMFAKYGLFFQPGGEMEKYFRKKDWYNPYQKDVSECLTAIEQRNLNHIARFEQL